MKKIIILLLIFLCLLINSIGSNSVFAATAILKQGIYTPADFGTSSNNIYTIKNISNTHGVSIFIYSENFVNMQSIKLEANSNEIDTIPIQPTYNLIVVGDGEITINPKSK